MGRDKLIAFQIVTVTFGKGIVGFFSSLFCVGLFCSFENLLVFSATLYFAFCVLSSSLTLSCKGFGTNFASKLLDGCNGWAEISVVALHTHISRIQPFTSRRPSQLYRRKLWVFLVPHITFIRPHHNRWTQSIRYTGPISRLRVPISNIPVLY